MIAAELFGRLDKKAIGKVIITEAIGTWPGGPAKIIEVRPDRRCPEIVFQVQAPDGDTIGVFEWENIEVVE